MSRETKTTSEIGTTVLAGALRIGSFGTARLCPVTPKEHLGPPDSTPAGHSHTTEAPPTPQWVMR